MLDTPEITYATAQHTAVIRLLIPRNQIQEVMGPGMAEVMATLAAQGFTPAGPWFTRYLRMDPNAFDLEIGVPVSSPVAPAGRVLPGQLPAATVARTVYHGPYEGLASAWGEFAEWIRAAGLVTSGTSFWEHYVVGPEANPDPASWRTEFNRPLAS